MVSNLERVEKDALELSERERAALASSLLRSLEEEGDGNNDASWIEEAQNRYQAYKDGKIKALPAEEVIESFWP